jgi:hypothetical protein
MALADQRLDHHDYIHVFNCFWNIWFYFDTHSSCSDRSLNLSDLWRRSHELLGRADRARGHQIIRNKPCHPVLLYFPFVTLAFTTESCRLHMTSWCIKAAALPLTPSLLPSLRLGWHRASFLSVPDLHHIIGTFPLYSDHTVIALQHGRSRTVHPH